VDSCAEILSIGHSIMPYDQFASHLLDSGVTAVADVRSSPFSRRAPQFSRDSLRPTLKSSGIAYVFMGEQLGGRPKEGHFFRNRIADYEKMATSSDFLRGLDRLIDGTKKHRIALVCSEHNPLDCHRCLLVGRALTERNLTMRHILSDGSIINQSEVERRLLQLAAGDTKNADDLFLSQEEQLVDAYRKQARKVAFQQPQDQNAECELLG